MDIVRTLAGHLALFGSLFFCTSDALAQETCIPVVYAFRHAEDTNPPSHKPIFTLTPTGTAHAKLYATMVPAFGNDFSPKFCPLAKVYATTKKDKVNCNGCASTTNPFDTAVPLAGEIMVLDPLTTAGGVDLHEFLGNGNTIPSNIKYDTDAAKALRAELLATANQSKSSALFWTSEGMHILGGAIINADSQVPVKTKTYSPPRNLAYVFKAQVASSGGAFGSFADIESKDRYVQCYNHVETTNQFNPPGPRFFDSGYYCGYADQANLGGTPGKCEQGDACGSSIKTQADNDMVKAKICKTKGLPEAGPGIYGRCD